MGSLDGAGLATLADVTTHHNIEKVTPDMRDVLKVCEVRFLGGMKKLPKGEAPAHERASRPGELRDTNVRCVTQMYERGITNLN
jgi:hypothetical protein